MRRALVGGSSWARQVRTGDRNGWHPDCGGHKIHVVYSGGRGETTWFVGTEDYLPRRRIRHFNIPGQGEGTLDITLTGLEVDPGVDADTFTMKLPEGYEQVDDFAP